MDRKHMLFFTLFLLFVWQLLCAIPLVEQFKQKGYLELCDTHHGTTAYDSLYACFDEFILFLQTHPAWAQKLRTAKERFIRSKDRHYYSTDFFGFYDESVQAGRSQISFYYCVHLHEFLNAHYPELSQISQISNFLNTCFEIQKFYPNIFIQAADELGLKSIFSNSHSNPPILFKVIKYLPSYGATRPHYDGTAFSLFLDSTDNQSLLLSSYKSSFTVTDFFSPVRTFDRRCHQNSILLIPGTLLANDLIYPTPHIVIPSGKTRYATIAFAMRPHYVLGKKEFSQLPNFNH